MMRCLRQDRITYSSCRLLLIQVPIDKYQKNLLKIIETIESHHTSLNTKPRIILLSPPPIREPLILQHLPHQANVRSRENTFAYSRVVMDLAVPPFVEKLDLHDAIELAPARSYIQNPTSFPTNSLRFENEGMILSMEEYLSDGLHLKNPSYEIMYKLVMEAIERRWPEIMPEKMTMPVPWWGDIVNQKEEQTRDEL